MHAYMYEHETLSTPHRSLSQVYRLLTRTLSHDPNDRMTGHPLVTLAYAVERFDSVCTFAASLLYKNVVAYIFIAVSNVVTFIFMSSTLIHVKHTELSPAATDVPTTVQIHANDVQPKQRWLLQNTPRLSLCARS